MNALFLGNAPQSYKLTILGFLIANPIIYLLCIVFGINGGPIVGWLILLQFIYTLAMALRCYPLLPGGLLTIESVLLGLVDPHTIYAEVEGALEVILLLMFMVAAIYFLRDLLLYIFSNLLTRVRNKYLLSVTFLVSAAVLSAFLDALTVTAVMITALSSFSIYINESLEEILSGKKLKLAKAEMHAFLRNITMHGLIGTAVGGVSTIVGEPQNLLIGNMVGWDFLEFMLRMAPVSIPIFFAGVAVCLLTEKLKIFGYGRLLPEESSRALNFLQDTVANQPFDLRLRIQAVIALILCVSLMLHVAAIGLIGLMVIILLTSFNGHSEEEDIAPAFHEAMPFTALLVVFFAVVGVIHEQHLFSGVTDLIFGMTETLRPTFVFIATGLLSVISDNVFVATIYVGEFQEAFDAGIIGRAEYEMLAIAVNAGTNIPSIGTPNGQAAFLFMLTSSLAPRIGLSYLKMVVAALPYAIIFIPLSIVAVQWIQ